MTNNKLKILETYKRTSMIPFDSTGIRIAFTLECDISNGVRIDVSWKLLLAMIFSTLYLCSLICFLFIEANTFVEYSDTFFPIATILISLFSCPHQVIVRSKTIEMTDHFEMLIEKRIQNSTSNNFYVESNEFVEKWTMIIHYYFSKIAVPCIMTVFITLSFVLYFGVNLKRDAFYLPYAIWFPFEWRNPLGYFLAVILEVLTLHYVPLIVLSDLYFVFGWCKLLAALSDDICAELQILDEQQERIDESICKIIEMHSTIKQFVFDLSDVFRFNCTVYFLWVMLGISDLLLMMLFESKLDSNLNLAPLLKSFYMRIVVLSVLFVLCYFAGNISDRFDRANIYEHCGWYEFPCEVQRLVPIIINTQKSVVVKGFGNVICSREHFKMVVRGGFSYFMMMRSFLK